MNRDLWEHYKQLIHLRRQNSALQTANIDFFHINPASKVLAYGRWHEAGMRLVVLVNFSSHDLADYSIPDFPADGPWQEWPRPEAVTSSQGRLITHLPALTARVFIWNP